MVIMTTMEHGDGDDDVAMMLSMMIHDGHDDVDVDHGDVEEDGRVHGA